MSQDHDPLFSVRDRLVVLTGGLGQLGRHSASALAARGARVALIDRATPGGGGLPTPVEGCANVRWWPADVTCRASLERALDQVRAVWGEPNALVKNAALDSPPSAPAAENGPFETYPEQSWDEVMAVNAKGAFLCAQVFGGAIARNGGGSIVNVCSIYGLVSPDQRLYQYRRDQGEVFFKPVAYAASKSALLNLTRYLATYWASAGVRVNTLTLGGVRRDQDERFLAAYAARVPLARMARADEYCGAIVFQLSDASSYMTGANLVVDGGWTAW